MSIAAVALLLSACAADTDVSDEQVSAVTQTPVQASELSTEPTQDVIAETSPALEPAPVESTESVQPVEEPLPEEEFTEVPAPLEAATDAALCLQGSWIADNAFYLASMQELGEGIDDVSGVVELTFHADGTLITEYRDWLISASPAGDPVTIFRSGADTGLYSISEGRISVVETGVGSTMIVKAGGIEMPIEPSPTEFSEATFTCGPEQVSINAPEGTLALTRN